jgi:hypothetical protein
MENNIFLTSLPIIVSIFSVWFAYRANSINAELAQENFKNSLIDKLKNAKYMILQLKAKNYDHREKMLLIDTIMDHLLYQQNNQQKEKYLTALERNTLSNLQEEVEDNIGIFLSTNSGSEENKNLAINAIKNYLKDL